MRGDPVPDQDHIARHCKGSQIRDDGTASGAAFRLRPGKDDYLSVNWLELLSADDRDEQIAALRDAFRAKGFDLRATARFAVSNVGEMRKEVREKSGDGRALHVRHEPFNKAEHGVDDSSHAGISGYTPDDDMVADLIAQAFRALYPAKA